MWVEIICFMGKIYDSVGIRCIEDGEGNGRVRYEQRARETELR